MTDNETPQTAWAIVVPPLPINGSNKPLTGWQEAAE